jgi:fatty acid desaturase
MWELDEHFPDAVERWAGSSPRDHTNLRCINAWSLEYQYIRICRAATALAAVNYALGENTIMSKNVGGLDRALRIIVGLALIALALGFLPGFAPATWGWVGIIPLATALIGFCPLYRLVGMNTCSR